MEQINFSSITVLLLSLLLSGCALFSPAKIEAKNVVEATLDKRELIINPELLKGCKPTLTVIDYTPSITFLVLLEARKEDIQIYFECKERHQKLIDFVKEIR